MNEILTQKKIYWRQRSQQLWLQHGEQNSKFFHASVFTASNTNWEEILNIVQKTIPDHLNLELLKPIQDDEVRFALFPRNPDKSPGLDGMTPGFCLKY